MHHQYTAPRRSPFPSLLVSLLISLFVSLRAVLFTALTGLILTSPALSQEPVGGFVKLNGDDPTGPQTSPELAVRDDGSFLVVWDGVAKGDVFGVSSRLYGPSGAPLTVGQTRLNTYTALTQAVPQVSVRDDGGFVVAWSSYLQASFDGNNLISRGVDAAGVPDTDEIVVSDAATGGLSHAIARSGDGTLMLSWCNQSLPTFSFQTQRLDAFGFLTGGVQTLDGAACTASHSSITALGSTGYAATFSSDFAGTVRTGLLNLQGAATLDGGAWGTTTNAVASPMVVRLRDGTVVLLRTLTFDGKVAIQGLRLDGNGQPGTSLFYIATRSAIGLDAVALPDGELAVVWSQKPNLSNGQNYTIYLQVFRPDGGAVAPAVQMPLLAGVGDYIQPTVGVDGDSTIFVAFTTTGDGGPDSSDIWMHRFSRPPLFSDGFENGGTSRWSEVVGGP